MIRSITRMRSINFLKKGSINVSLYIARRYLKTKRKKNVINLITRISVIGIAVITMALIVLLSAFNGIEEMITRLYSEFDPDLTLRLKEGKSFNQDRVSKDYVLKIDGVEHVAFGFEEEVILKHEDKWANATLIGVDSSFLAITQMEDHMVDGAPVLQRDGESFALIGASLLDRLDGFIPSNVGHESIFFYAPKKKIKLSPGKNPFYMKMFKLSGRYNFNREVNAETVVLPMKAVRDLMEQSDKVTVLFVDVKDGMLESVKSSLSAKFGSEFDVRSNFEKNELIFKTSRSEKLIVILILGFIFILAAFNLVASLIMLFVEKKNDVRTLISIGADKQLIFRIFFLEGILISFKGILIGGVLGYGISLLQLKFGLLTMPNTGGEVFPVSLSLRDGLIIFGLVGSLSFIFSYFPVKYLVRNALNDIRSATA
ncbi:MAG: ABC transporter permease [Bacteroidetes bacterium]|nr:MAG: ABC transporter permease [Bacteroidota bacterium]